MRRKRAIVGKDFVREEDEAVGGFDAVERSDEEGFEVSGKGRRGGGSSSKEADAAEADAKRLDFVGESLTGAR